MTIRPLWQIIALLILMPLAWAAQKLISFTDWVADIGVRNTWDD